MEFKIDPGYRTTYCQKAGRQTRTVSSLVLSEGLAYGQPEHLGVRGKAEGLVASGTATFSLKRH